MSSSYAVPPIHSTAEALLYFRIMRCKVCGHGPLKEQPSRTGRNEVDRDLLIRRVTCRACGHVDEVRFDKHLIQRFQSTADDQAAARAAGGSLTPRPINPTDEPSRIIDVAGWLTLHSLLSEDANSAEAREWPGAGKPQWVRRLRIRAGQCLEEALKFYDADNDLPPVDAFFSKAALAQFRKRPELFTRQRLIELRAALPRISPPRPDR